MEMNILKRKYPFYIGITTLMLTIIISLTGIFFWITYKETSTVAIQTADRLFDVINEKVSERYQHALGSSGHSCFKCFNFTGYISAAA